MRLRFFALILLIAPGSATSLQESPPASIPQAPEAILVEDTYASIELTHSLDAKKAKVGDRVEGKLINDVLDRQQNVIAHTGRAKVIGHVADVHLRGREGDHSNIIFAFDQILTDDNRQIPITAIVIRIAVEQQVSSGIGSHPTSGDDPAARAAGPMVDSNGRPVESMPPPLEAGGLARPQVRQLNRSSLQIATNAVEGQTRVTNLGKKDVKIDKGAIITLTMNDPRPKQ